MVAERHNLDATDKLLTDEYRQLNSDTPNRSALGDAQNGECGDDSTCFGAIWSSRQPASAVGQSTPDGQPRSTEPVDRSHLVLQNAHEAAALLLMTRWSAMQRQHTLGLQLTRLLVEVQTFSFCETKQSERSRDRDGKAAEPSSTSRSATAINWRCQRSGKRERSTSQTNLTMNATVF